MQSIHRSTPRNHEQLGANRVLRPFPEAEAVALLNHVNDALYHQYYDQLLIVSKETLKRDLAKNLGCQIAQIHHVLNADAQELDVIVTLNATTVPARPHSKEKRQ